MQLFLVILAAFVASVVGHGRLHTPISRGSAWRFGYNRRANYDDNGLNCGGFYHQWEVNGGRCGICGDPYDSQTPRNHELGGVYGDDTIYAEYSSGDTIDTTIAITAYHMGYWELRICDDPLNNEQECFKHLLELEEGGTKYYPTGTGEFDVRYRLPRDLVCDHCVLQWKYTAGNNWGVCDNGTQGMGCGNQETFWSCADITIKGVVSEDVDLPEPIPVENPILHIV